MDWFSAVDVPLLWLFFANLRAPPGFQCILQELELVPARVEVRDFGAGRFQIEIRGGKSSFQLCTSASAARMFSSFF
jgi:hypothetical protein